MKAFMVDYLLLTSLLLCSFLRKTNSPVPCCFSWPTDLYVVLLPHGLSPSTVAYLLVSSFFSLHVGSLVVKTLSYACFLFFFLELFSDSQMERLDIWDRSINKYVREDFQRHFLYDCKDHKRNRV